MDRNSCSYKIGFSALQGRLSSSRCRHPHWSAQLLRRCLSGVGRPHCLMLLQTLGLTPPRMLGQATRGGIHQIQSGSSCSHRPIAPSQTGVALFSSSQDDRCRSRLHRSLQNAGGCRPRCRNGFCLHRIRCRTQYAFCGCHRHQNLSRCLFVVCR